MIGRFADTESPPDGVSVSNARAWNALLDRHPKLAALCDGSPDAELALELAALRDEHEEQGVRSGIAPLPVTSHPRLAAYERLVLAAIGERQVDGVARITVGEIATRLRPDPLTADRLRVERAVFRLLTRRHIARCAGGGFVLLRRAA